MQRLWGIVSYAVVGGEYAQPTPDDASPGAASPPVDPDASGAEPDAHSKLLQEDLRKFDECVDVLRCFADGGLDAVNEAALEERRRLDRPQGQVSPTVELESGNVSEEKYENGDDGQQGVDVSSEGGSGSVGVPEAREKDVDVATEVDPAGGAQERGVNGSEMTEAPPCVRASSSQRVVVVSTVVKHSQESATGTSQSPISKGEDAALSGEISPEAHTRLDDLGESAEVRNGLIASSIESVSEDGALGEASGDDQSSPTRPSQAQNEDSRLPQKDKEPPEIEISTTETNEPSVADGGNSQEAEENASSTVKPPEPAADRVVMALARLAELMVRSDRTNAALWERFLEFGCMKLIVACLRRTHAKADDADIPEAEASSGQTSNEFTPVVAGAASRAMERGVAVRIQANILRTLSIIVHSVKRRESLYCLFASDHVNNLLSFEFDFADDEVLLYFMSAVKSIGVILDNSLVELFFDAGAGTFPLYSCTTRFFAHPDGMVRIAVRNLTLTVYALRSPSVTDYAVNDPSDYLGVTVDRLARLCGEVAGAFEFLLDDGREVRQSVSRRVGRFRHKVRMPHLQAELAEIDNLLEYLNDVLAVDDALLRKRVEQLVVSRFFKPFFRPISSQAAPEALAAAARRWGFRSQKDPNAPSQQAALTPFDAAARAMVLGYIITLLGSHGLGRALFAEISRPSAQFQRRTVLHGLRAMASDLTGRERTTHIAVCVLDVVVRWEVFPVERMRSLRFTFDLDDDDAKSIGEPVSRSGSTEAEAQSPNSVASVEPAMVMSLVDFRAPLTPTGSLTKTDSASSDVMSAPNSPKSPASPAERDDVDDEGILYLFRRGEASLREVVSAILLVVRTREVRSVRVAQAVVRLIATVGARTGLWRLSLDIAKIALDEMASTMTEFLANDGTTIVAIEAAFENFSLASSERSPASEPVPDVSALFRISSLHRFAADLPDGAGRRRRSAALGNAAVSPVENADATSFFVLLRAYEGVLAKVLTLQNDDGVPPPSPKERALSSGVCGILQREDASSTYLDKKEALARAAHLTLKYNIFSRNF